MNFDAKKHRFALTMLFSLVVFVLLAITSVLISTVIVILNHTGVLHIGNNAFISDLYAAALMLSSMVIGTVLASTMGMLPLKPVNKIINTLNRLAGGDYRARLNFNGPLGRNRTIREITDSFNAMHYGKDNWLKCDGKDILGLSFCACKSAKPTVDDYNTPNKNVYDVIYQCNVNTKDNPGFLLERK
jgi:hypothetical protein